MHYLRRNFLAGLVVLIPFAVILWMANLLVRLSWRLYEALPSTWKPPQDMSFWANSLALLIVITAVVFLIAVLGWVSKHYLGQKLLGVFRLLIEKIPFLGTIYSSLDQLFKTFSSDSRSQFSGVVYVEYPRKGSWVVGFVTGPVKNQVLDSDHINLFVPTVPNPTSGFHIMVPSKDVRESDMSVEDAFKTILSLGIVQKKQEEES